MRKILATIFAVLMVSMVQAAEPENKDVENRIKPVGQVYVAGAQAQAAVAAPTGPRSGADVYQASCFACHGTGAMGAPKKGDAAAWQARKAQGMDVLLEHAIKGFNAMPPMGTCMACSNDEIKAAVEFMLK